MPVKNEGKYAGEYLASEGNGERSRDVMTLVQGQSLAAGAILGVVTASGKVTQVAPAANDGSQTAAKILYANADTTATGTNADTPVVVTARDSEVNGAEITYPTGATPAQIATINQQLAQNGIIVRTGL